MLSVVIPARNEEQNIGLCLRELRRALGEQTRIPHELIVVNDNSTDGTEEQVRSEIEHDPSIRLINRQEPPGFGRAVRAGLEAVAGDVVILFMADLSDDPADAVAYYYKIRDEGFDCVFGSRFIRGSRAENYPRLKLCVNRLVNKLLQALFWTHFNDLTNAFKAYRTEVIRDCGPYLACHFNITIEMSLGALIRRYRIVQMPISWHGRTWGCSKLSLFAMGRRYLSTLLLMFAQYCLISDDLLAERAARNVEFHRRRNSDELESNAADSNARRPA
ncbi:MAG: glycosyltransferase family 2 protein [Planctomycetaceae bacterium]